MARGAVTWWCRSVLLLALAALVTSALVRGLTDQHAGRQSGALPGLTGFLGVLLVVQAGLLVLLTATVAVLAWQARRDGLYGVASTDANKEKTGRPYLGGNLTTLVAALGFSLGGLLTAVINFGVARLVGTPEPSGYLSGSAPSDALAVPWPTYAFGAAPVGLLCGSAVAGIVLGIRYKHRLKDFAIPGPGFSPVHKAYAHSTARAPGSNADGDDSDYSKTRKRIGAAWAIGRIADDAAAAVMLAVGGCLLLVLAAEIILAAYARLPGRPGLYPYCGRVRLPRSRLWSSRCTAAWWRCCARPIPTRPAARPSGWCGMWVHSGRGRCIRSPRHATPNEPCPR